MNGTFVPFHLCDDCSTIQVARAARARKAAVCSWGRRCMARSCCSADMTLKALTRFCRPCRLSLQAARSLSGQHQTHWLNFPPTCMRVPPAAKLQATPPEPAHFFGMVGDHSNIWNQWLRPLRMCRAVNLLANVSRARALFLDRAPLASARACLPRPQATPREGQRDMQWCSGSR